MIRRIRDNIVVDAPLPPSIVWCPKPSHGAKGPRGRANAEVMIHSFRASTKAELASCHANTGPATAHASVGAKAGISAGASGVMDMIDTFDRPGNAYTAETYADAGTYAHACEDKPMKRVPRAGAHAGAGVGLARAEFSVFEAEARGPNARAGVEANPLGVQAFARAELAGASASAGPVKATLGLSADTGVGIGAEGLEIKVLGTGFTIGERPSLSLFGSSVECVIS